MERFSSSDTTCTGTPTKVVSSWAQENTCLSVGTAMIKDWSVQGGDGSEELYVKAVCTDNSVTETVYIDKDCTTLAASANGKNSSVEHSVSCAKGYGSWSLLGKGDRTKYTCGSEYPVLTWSVYNDDRCQTRKNDDYHAITYEPDGGCQGNDLRGEEFIDPAYAVSSKKATCSDSGVAWLNYGSFDCSGSVTSTDRIATNDCAFSARYQGYVKIVGGACSSTVSMASFACSPGVVALFFMMTSTLLRSLQ